MEMGFIEDLSSQAKLWNTMFGFAKSLVLRCAVQLDLATIIHNHGAPMTISELSMHLQPQPVSIDPLYRIMRYLVHLEIFTQSSTGGETRYGLAPQAKFLVKGWEKCMDAIILCFTDKDLGSPLYNIKEGLLSESGMTIAEKTLGMNSWQYFETNPEKSRLFNEGMAGDTRLIMSAVVKECSAKFDGITTLVDVGGGTGTAAMHVAKAFPSIKCTVYDLPHVIADAPHNSEIDFVGGDMFKYVPKADAIMMKSVLHDYDDVKCIEILKRCKEAVPRDGGKVIILDVVMDVEPEHPFTKTRLNFDMLMMLMSGKERTEEEWKKLFDDAGYRGYQITQISSRPSLIEAYPY